MFVRLRKSFYRTINKIFTETVIEVLFMGAILVAIYFSLGLNGQNFFSKVDVTVFLAVIVAFIVNMVKTSISRFIRKKIEDFNKLSDDYNYLIKQYPCEKNLIKYKNTAIINRFLYRKTLKKYKDGKVKFPVIIERILYDAKFEIEDKPQEQYELPERIKENYETIMHAHEFSDVYNQLNIRLSDYEYDKATNSLKLITTRTTYFDSLVTNRAMDYKWGLKSSNREIYDFGPYVNPLKESKLSNHLGFNGFVETSDGKIVFVNRSNNVSIGKGTLGNSVGASLKTMYALNEDKEFTENGLVESMIKEIHDELKLEREDFNFSSKNIIAIYRDLVEGGKPQLLFYVKTSKSSKEVDETFINAIKKTEKAYLQTKLAMDGNELVFIDRNRLKEVYITPEMIIFGGRSYLTMPSASAAIVILMNYLEGREKK
ncbi:hypothetical protein ACQKL6_14445 [Peribacillus sp. NPDC097197]|uniref:hypothetical protein n=1 Tax=unclassified Peribacillus TaxID=2675266 RepID=UPI0037F7012D